MTFVVVTRLVLTDGTEVRDADDGTENAPPVRLGTAEPALAEGVEDELVVDGAIWLSQTEMKCRYCYMSLELLLPAVMLVEQA